MCVHVDDDVLWMIFTRVMRPRLLELRAVCRAWRGLIDDRQPADWKRMFEERVMRCVALAVGDDFDWKRAMVRAARHECIRALCIWTATCVPVAAPWASNVLRRGVTRVNGNERYVDFIYNDTLRVRALKRSCYNRNDTDQCSNCRTRERKRRCLNPQYDYFVRAVHGADDRLVDETLILNLAQSSQSTPSGRIASVLMLGPS